MDWFLFGVAFAVVAVLWYLYYGLEAFLNGGQGVFEGFRQDLSWYGPGGLQKRAAYIRELVGKGRGVMVSVQKSWKFEEIREKGNYEEVAKVMMDSPAHFWISKVVFPLLAIFLLFGLLRAIFL